MLGFWEIYRLTIKAGWPAGLQPVLVYMSKNEDGKYSFDPVSVNFLTEILKTSIAFSVLLVLVSPAHWRLICIVPALLFVNAFLLVLLTALLFCI